MEKTCNVNGRFFRGVLVGSFLGVMAGMFLAPKSGKELRSDVKEKNREAQAFIEDTKNRAAELKECARYCFVRMKKAFGKERVSESMEESEGMA